MAMQTTLHWWINFIFGCIHTFIFWFLCMPILSLHILCPHIDSQSPKSSKMTHDSSSQTTSFQWSTSGYERQKSHWWTTSGTTAEVGRWDLPLMATDGPPVVHLVGHPLSAGHPYGGPPLATGGIRWWPTITLLSGIFIDNWCLKWYWFSVTKLVRNHISHNYWTTYENVLFPLWSLLKWNESAFRPPLCIYRLNRATPWRWWDEWDDTVLQTQDSKFEPWQYEAPHATSRSRRLPTPRFWSFLTFIPRLNVTEYGL